MKSHDAHAEPAQCQAAAAAERQAHVGANDLGPTVRRSALQFAINQSPRMQAQRRAIDAAFGSAIQRQADGFEDEEPLQARADTAQAESAFAQREPSAVVTAPAPVQTAQTSAPLTHTPVRAEPVEAPPNLTGMPTQLKAGIESLSGMDMSDVRVHRNSDKPAQLNALAYAQGNEIHLGPGQEQHLPHEAWHVVQQRQGRVQPTMQMAGVGVNDEVGLEREADLMGGRAVLQGAGMGVGKRQNLTSNVMTRNAPVGRAAKSSEASRVCTVAQCVMATWLTTHNHVLGGPARFESTNNRGTGQGKKPLLVIRATVPHQELHVHLIPISTPVSYSGWNLKDTRGGGSYVHIDNTTQTIDAEDRTLFNTQAAGWALSSSYPNDIAWSEPSEESRLAEGARQFAARRTDMVGRFAAKRESHVARVLKTTPISMTMTFTTFARRTSGKKETATQHRQRVTTAKPLPAVDGCEGAYRIADAGQVTAIFKFTNFDTFTAGRVTVIAAMLAPIPDGRLWTHHATTDTQADVENAIRTRAQDHIDSVSRGDRDDVVRAWDGKAGSVTFPP